MFHKGDKVKNKGDLRRKDETGVLVTLEYSSENFNRFHPDIGKVLFLDGEILIYALEDLENIQDPRYQMDPNIRLALLELKVDCLMASPQKESVK